MDSHAAMSGGSPVSAQTPTAERYPHVFSPLTIAGMTIPNRIVRAAHSTTQQWGSRAFVAYHVARARGEVGMTVLGAASVHPSAPMDIPAHHDGVLDGYRRLVDAVAPHGMRLLQQLWHGGAVLPANAVGGPPWSASAVASPARGVVPIPMTTAMIDDVVAGFAEAAGRVHRGGLDGVEIHAGHGYLVAQFLSPLTNRRDDGYGGDLEGRTRFLREILAAVRATVGPDFPVGVRLSCDEEVPGGLVPPDVADIARLVEPQVDFIDVTLAGYYHFHRLVASADAAPSGYEIPAAEIVTRAVSVPTMVTGRLATLDHAEHLLGSGTADMISMVRATIADPDLVRKARHGREARIRPCIGTNEGCLGGRHGAFGCVVNPAAGHEDVWGPEPPTAVRPLRVLVAGGGPAGMEAARTAAIRGHQVTLLEATGRLGGQVTIGASAPHRVEYGAHVAWLEDELAEAGVTVRMRTPIEPDILAGLAPDAVVLATGSVPRRDGSSIARPGTGLAPADLRHIVTGWDVLGFGGRARIGATAVVADDAGGFEAISVTEALLAHGAAVTLVTRLEAPGAAMPDPRSTVDAARERLGADPRVRVITNAVVCGADGLHAEIERLGSRCRELVPAETVAMVGINEPTGDEIREALAEVFTGPIHVIGDAAHTRTLREAISSGALLAMNL